jgi:hypothetical protein
MLNRNIMHHSLGFYLYISELTRTAESVFSCWSPSKGQMSVWFLFEPTGKKINAKANRLWRPIGLWDVEAPTFQDNRFTDDGEIVSLRRRPHFSSRKIPSAHLQSLMGGCRIRELASFLYFNVILKELKTIDSIAAIDILKLSLLRSSLVWRNWTLYFNSICQKFRFINPCPASTLFIEFWV